MRDQFRLKSNELAVVQTLLNWGNDAGNGWKTQQDILEYKEGGRLLFRSPKATLRFHYLEPLKEKGILESKVLGKRKGKRKNPTHWRIRQNTKTCELLRQAFGHAVYKGDFNKKSFYVQGFYDSKYVQQLGFLFHDDVLFYINNRREELLEELEMLDKIRDKERKQLNKKIMFIKPKGGSSKKKR